MEPCMHWLWLALKPTLTPTMRLQLVQEVGSPAFLYKATAEEYGQSLPTDIIRALIDKDLSAAEKVKADCEAHDIRLICWEDADYPIALRMLEDAPLVLYLRGQIPDFTKHPPLTLMGTRAVSPYGVDMTMRFTTAFAAGEFSFVLGSSLGVETIALTTALQQQAPVLLVQVGGAELNYPKENTELLAQIAKQGGILSENPPNTGNEGYRFFQRNRLLCALSYALIVVEAPPQSGSLRAVSWAQDFGKPTYAIPNRLDAANMGCNLIIREGAATLLTDPTQIVADLQPLLPITPPLHKIIRGFRQDKKEAVEIVQPVMSVKSAAPIKPMLRQKPPIYPKKIKIEPPVLSPEQQRIADAVQQGMHDIDAIAQHTQIPAQNILTELTMMEILGMVTNTTGLYHWIETT